MPKFVRAWAQGLWFIAAALVLGAVFAMYLQPDFLIRLAGQVWACF